MSTIEEVMADLNKPYDPVQVVKDLLEHAVYDEDKSDECIDAVQNARGYLEQEAVDHAVDFHNHRLGTRLMAFKLSKSEETRLDKLIEEVGTGKQRLDDGIEELNAKFAELVEQFNSDYVEPYNETLQEAYQFVEDIAAERRDEYDKKSERWQEGDRGQAASEWVDAWEALTMELDQVNTASAPTVDFFAEDALDALEQLPREMDVF